MRLFLCLEDKQKSYASCRRYSNPNKFSYIPSPVGEGRDEDNLNTNLLGLVLFHARSQGKQINCRLGRVSNETCVCAIVGLRCAHRLLQIQTVVVLRI
jgi:hypothetical protein